MYDCACVRVYIMYTYSIRLRNRQFENMIYAHINNMTTYVYLYYYFDFMRIFYRTFK